jgi:hypothetical protein
MDLSKLDFLKRQRLSRLLGLALDGNRLDGIVLKLAEGTLQVQQSFSVSLSLDPLTNDPELVGREIRNHLDAAGIHERHCVVGLPLKWVLTTHVEVPQLPEADVASFLQIEAERGFPCDVTTLQVCTSTCRTSAGKQYAVFAGIPQNHLALLEQTLRVAKLKPVSFSLGMAALQPSTVETSQGVLALVIGESHVGLQIVCGGGVAALRALEGALELEGSRRVLQADLVAREARITLGQLPAELRDTVRHIRVFGPRDLGQQLADEMELRLDSMGLKVELAGRYNADTFGLRFPQDAAVTPAFSLAGQRLAGRGVVFEFLPPKVTAWQQMTTRYASGKLRTALSAAGAVAVLVGGFFSWQQIQLWRLNSQWSKMADTVKQLEAVQGNIRTYRPWFDPSVRALTILRSLTEAFPETGDVTAKTIEIRDLKTITCTGTARSYPALLQTIQRLRTTRHIEAVNQGPTRGQAPALQFTFNVVWGEGGNRAN